MAVGAPGHHGTSWPALIQSHGKLSRTTVIKGLAELGAQGWYGRGAIDREPHAARVFIPAELLTDRRINTQGRVLYGHLQLLPRFARPRGDSHTPN